MLYRFVASSHWFALLSRAFRTSVLCGMPASLRCSVGVVLFDTENGHSDSGFQPLAGGREGAPGVIAWGTLGQPRCTETR